MDAVRFKNLRNLEDTDFIQIKPITFLLGGNSSGKSTFLRSFPLIKQSVLAKTTGPILWYGDLVDLGNFNEALNNKSSNKEISFSYKFKIPSTANITHRNLWLSLYHSLRLIEDIDVTIEIKMTAAEENLNVTFCKEISIFISDHCVIIEISPTGEVTKFLVNENNFLNQELQLRIDQTGSFLPQLFWINKEYDNRYFAYYTARGRNYLFSENLKKKIKDLVSHNASQARIASLMKSLGIGSSQIMLSSIKKENGGGKIWTKNVSNWNQDNSEYKHLRDLIIANSTAIICSSCDEYISRFALNISYLGPVRATAERYYRSQDLAVKDVDSQGKNLTVFIKSLNVDNQADFARWTKENFGFSVCVRSFNELVSLKILENDSQSEINLADSGFGFSQILPILTQLWWLCKKLDRLDYNLPIVFAIEQPELHLHPKLQALLADSFITTIKSSRELGIDLRLIIETHSETLINRLGHQIANKNFSNEDVNVVIFNREIAEQKVNIILSKYDEDGFLINWPLGFFEPDII